jgi:hypothetical protein
MKPGDLVRVARPYTLDADMRRLGFWGRQDGRALFIDTGTLGMVVHVRNRLYLVAFGDKVCSMDELALEPVDEAR